MKTCGMYCLSMHSPFITIHAKIPETCEYHFQRRFLVVICEKKLCDSNCFSRRSNIDEEIFSINSFLNHVIFSAVGII
jgi:hypothetical protein